MDSTDRKSELPATLADGVHKLTDSEAWKSWLRVQRRFHRYSWGNTVVYSNKRSLQCKGASNA